MISALLRFVYPPTCLHCSSLIEGKRELLCSSCFSELKLLSIDNRCPRCFSPYDENKVCLECRRYDRPIERIAGVFETCPVANTFLKHIKYYEADYLAKTLASFFVLQLDKMNWMGFDGVVAFPTRTAKTIAKHVSKLLGIPHEKKENKKLLIVTDFLSSPTDADKFAYSKKKNGVSLQLLSFILGF